MTETAGLATSEKKNLIRTEQYAAITSMEDALALINEVFAGEVVDASELGDGFALLSKEDKPKLIGVPFVILSATFSEGDYKDENGEKRKFVSLRLVTEDGKKFIVNDGSSGISEQIETLWKMKPETEGKPMLCKKGLRVSEYDHPQHGPSKTFYIDTSAS